MLHRFAVLGSVFGFLGVALGAFAAHGLASKLSEKSLAVFHTGAQYQMYHALALVALGLSALADTRATALAGWCFTGGILIFSGSLYLLAVTGVRALGMITPIGGVLFLVGWLSLGWSLWKR